MPCAHLKCLMRRWHAAVTGERCRSAGAGVAWRPATRRRSGDGMTRRAGDGAARQAGDGTVVRWRRGDLRRHGRTSSGGRDERCGHVQAIGRRKLGKEASATATVRVLVEAGLRGKKPGRQVNGPLCFIGRQFVTSCAAMGLDTIDLRTLSFWRPCAAAHLAHGLRRA